MRRHAVVLLLGLVAAPLAAQTGPVSGKVGKTTPPIPAEVLAELRRWAERGDYVLAVEPLVAVVREPIKVLGFGSLDREGRMAVKGALLRVERRIRSAVESVSAGATSPLEGRAEVRHAVEAYASTLEVLLRTGR